MVDFAKRIRLWDGVTHRRPCEERLGSTNNSVRVTACCRGCVSVHRSAPPSRLAAISERREAIYGAMPLADRKLRRRAICRRS
jgi:hypothetical protein